MSDNLPHPLTSELDSKRFGVRIGRANISNVDECASILESCRLEVIRMLIVRCRTDDFYSIHHLEAANARLMDTLVYYQRNLRKGAVPEELVANIIRPMQDSDIPKIQSLVGETFRDYLGHYHADPRLDRAKCDEGYVEWAAKMCMNRDPSNEVLVAEDSSGVLAGFATLRLNKTDEGEGVLFGVHPSFEGRGIYWSFMVHAMNWCRNRGAARMIVSTQITNTAVQKVWARLGFEVVRSFYTFHLWFD
jgi:ribosomal protein S18 acetylase RimI-like enzyme